MDAVDVVDVASDFTAGSVSVCAAGSGGTAGVAGTFGCPVYLMVVLRALFSREPQALLSWKGLALAPGTVLAPSCFAPPDVRDALSVPRPPAKVPARNIQIGE